MSGSESEHPMVAAARAALAHLQLPLPPAPAGSNMDHLLPHFLHRSPPSPCFLLLRTQHKPKPPQPQLHLLLCTAFDSLAHSLQEVLDKHKSKLHLDTLFLHENKPHAFLSNLPFAKMVGVPPPSSPPAGILSTPSVSAHHQDQPPTPTPTQTEDNEEIDNHSPPPRIRLLNIPVDRLRSTLSTLSLTELIDLVPHLVARSLPSPDTHPDKKKLFSVHDFFRYAEFEGKRFFEELDRDGDGQVTLEDLEVAMRKRRLPRRYARDFLRRTRSNLFSKSIGWKQFLSLMEQKEPTILRAYTTLCLSKSGTLHKNQILTSLKGAGLPANEDNAAAMLRYLNADSEESISYSHFRNFMLLLPSERLEDDPRNIWFEAATLVAVPPPVEISTGSVLKSALAGGLASALSTSVMHPIDSMKTRVQASSLSFPDLISTLPQIGLRGLYRGSIPAILGQFSSHGLRTGIFEASKLVLKSVAPTLPDIQVQSLSSFCSTILGTAVRIPCEVLKQRLQAGIFNNVGEAIVGTMQKDGPKGFFRGTGATLCREVPFYVAGMCLYAEAKKAAQHVLNRDLEPWETIAVGALSGGLAAVVTTPFDVMKTRMMTAPPGTPVSMQLIVFSILRNEGPLGLFKGAIPRFFWIAPLGAMNFAGYELAKKAMIQTESDSADSVHEKRTTVGSRG
ncbi:calcium-dependent mitochondrial ATP-magnesium/phosphate carrier protein 1-like [Oryza glaberrima]|uniref:calcium-dependent mitochondrial ATP-magnesium/phosphate carrier protein 1-like n=1 Tax=Oryza glaberrima TaxID=4538 RepID=UPI00224C10A3|nr:calcium-dependent mitochondrial ATP-magnesium/phosphate carrier protein 1-like [Oryza glaberrima]